MEIILYTPTWVIYIHARTEWARYVHYYQWVMKSHSFIGYVWLLLPSDLCSLWNGLLWYRIKYYNIDNLRDIGHQCILRPVAYLASVNLKAKDWIYFFIRKKSSIGWKLITWELMLVFSYPAYHRDQSSIVTGKTQSGAQYGLKSIGKTKVW